MGNISVKTDQVLKAATSISTCNLHIETAFDAVETAMSNLNHVWEGQASNNAADRFSSIKKGYKDTRYQAMNNYVDFLNRQVGAGYETVETANTSLADAFK